MTRRGHRPRKMITFFFILEPISYTKVIFHQHKLCLFISIHIYSCHCVTSQQDQTLQSANISCNTASKNYLLDLPLGYTQIPLDLQVMFHNGRRQVQFILLTLNTGYNFDLSSCHVQFIFHDFFLNAKNLPFT